MLSLTLIEVHISDLYPLYDCFLTRAFRFTHFNNLVISHMAMYGFCYFYLVMTIWQDCSQSILSNPPSNLNQHSLLKPFQHASLRSHHYSDALFDMANRL